jgi:glycosyltransferase involved in cell wall biosynthesis
MIHAPTKLLISVSVPIHLQTLWLPYPKHFRSKGWVVDAAARAISKDADCCAAFDQVHDVGFVRNPLSQPWTVPLRFRETLLRLRNLVIQERYDIVHVSTPMGAFMTRLAIRNLRPRVKVIYTAQGFHFFKGNPSRLNTVWHFVERMAAAWTDYLITNNQEDYKAAQRFGTIPPERVRYFPGIGVDLSVYQHLGDRVHEEVRTELKIGPEDKLFLHVAELIPRKRQADAINALAKCRDSRFHLVLAGNGKGEQELKQLVANLQLIRNVHFVGFRRDVPRLMTAADALLLPSQHEGMPRCIMEAMCIGLPVIASDIRGTRDLLGGGRGTLLPVRDVDALAEALVQIAESPDEAKVRAALAKAHIPKHDLALILSLHEDIYEEALTVGAQARGVHKDRVGWPIPLNLNAPH